MEARKKCVIIGAGLTGVSAAYFLRKKESDFLVLEKNDVIGGTMQSFREGEYVFESGPSTGTISNVTILKLLDELGTKIKVTLGSSVANKRFILKNKKWHALPSSLGTAVRTPLFRVRDKFRILGEPWRKAGTNENETVADMVVRRLGKSFLSHAVDPFVSGVYAGDPNYLVTKYALPKLYNLEHNYGSFVKGTIAKSKLPKTEDEKRIKKNVFSVEGGFSTLINTMADSVGRDRILTSCQNIEINPQGGNYVITFSQNGESCKVEAEYVVIASNSLSLQSLLPFVPKQKLSACSSMIHAKMVQVALGFDKWEGIKVDGFGGLIPRAEKEDVLGVLYMSTLFENRAPKDGALFAIFMGGMSRPEMVEKSDTEIKEIVKDLFIRLYGVKDFDPDLFRIFRHQTAIPQYGADSKQRFEEVETLMAENPKLFYAGNCMNGIGIADRINRAFSVIENVK